MFTKLLRLENLKKVKKAIFIVMPALALLAALLLTSDAEASGRPLWERLNRTRWDFNRFPVRQCPICGAGSWTTAAGQIQTYLTALSGASTAATAARLTTRGAADLAELKQGIDDLKTQLQQAQTAKDALDGSNFDSIPNIAQERANAADTVNKIKGYLLRGLLNRIEAERATATGNALTNLNNYKNNLSQIMLAPPNPLTVGSGQILDLDDANMLNRLLAEGKVSIGADGTYRLLSLTVAASATLKSSKEIVVAGGVDITSPWRGSTTNIEVPKINVIGPYDVNIRGNGTQKTVTMNVNVLDAPDSAVNFPSSVWTHFNINGDIVAKTMTVPSRVDSAAYLNVKKIFTAGDINMGYFVYGNIDEIHVAGNHSVSLSSRRPVGNIITINKLVNIPDGNLSVDRRSFVTVSGATGTVNVKNLSGVGSVGAAIRYTGSNVQQIPSNEPAEYIPGELRDMNGSTLLNLANNFPQ